MVRQTPVVRGRGPARPETEAEPSAPRKPYRPSNGTEGDGFQAMWCMNCKREAAFRVDPERADGCWIIVATMAYDISDPEYPPEWQYSPRGQPICTAYDEIEDGR